ncbi:hypothetical protein Ddc_11551 [Ditylenchus destructor]|nr:hypothetical protein Ddc_11551 [Ditylenchus destructor]
MGVAIKLAIFMLKFYTSFRVIMSCEDERNLKEVKRKEEEEKKLKLWGRRPANASDCMVPCRNALMPEKPKIPIFFGSEPEPDPENAQSTTIKVTHTETGFMSAPRLGQRQRQIRKRSGQKKREAAARVLMITGRELSNDVRSASGQAVAGSRGSSKQDDDRPCTSAQAAQRAFNTPPVFPRCAPSPPRSDINAAAVLRERAFEKQRHIAEMVRVGPWPIVLDSRKPWTLVPKPFSAQRDEKMAEARSRDKLRFEEGNLKGNNNAVKRVSRVTSERVRAYKLGRVRKSKEERERLAAGVAKAVAVAAERQLLEERYVSWKRERETVIARERFEREVGVQCLEAQVEIQTEVTADNSLECECEPPDPFLLEEDFSDVGVYGDKMCNMEKGKSVRSTDAGSTRKTRQQNWMPEDEQIVMNYISRNSIKAKGQNDNEKQVSGSISSRKKKRRSSGKQEVETSPKKFQCSSLNIAHVRDVPIDKVIRQLAEKNVELLRLR